MGLGRLTMRMPSSLSALGVGARSVGLLTARPAAPSLLSGAAPASGRGASPVMPSSGSILPAFRFGASIQVRNSTKHASGTSRNGRKSSGKRLGPKKLGGASLYPRPCLPPLSCQFRPMRLFPLPPSASSCCSSKHVLTRILLVDLRTCHTSLATYFSFCPVFAFWLGRGFPRPKGQSVQHPVPSARHQVARGRKCSLRAGPHPQLARARVRAILHRCAGAQDQPRGACRVPGLPLPEPQEGHPGRCPFEPAAHAHDLPHTTTQALTPRFQAHLPPLHRDHLDEGPEAARAQGAELAPFAQV